MKRRYLMFLLKLAITGLILYFLFSAVDIHTIGAYVTRISPLTFSFAVLGYVAATILSTVRWSLLLRMHGVTVPLPRLLGYNLSYLFYSLVLPGGKMSAEAVRMYQIVRDTGRVELRQKVILPTLVDRAISVFTYALVALGAFLFSSADLANLPNWFPYAIGGVILLSIGTVFLPIERILQTVAGRFSFGDAATTSFTEVVTMYRRHPLPLGGAVVLTLCMLGSMSGATAVIAHSLGFSISMPVLVGVFAVSMIAAFLPLTIAGIGVREGIFGYLLATLSHVPLEAALSIAFIALISSHAVTLIGGLIELQRHFLRNPQ